MVHMRLSGSGDCHLYALKRRWSGSTVTAPYNCTRAAAGSPRSCLAPASGGSSPRAFGVMGETRQLAPMSRAPTAALAAAMNPSCAGGNHAAIYIERQVLSWFKEMRGCPADSIGHLVSGGSMASLTALVFARHAKAGFDVRRWGFYKG
jgi:hypothetical protein